MAQFHFVEDYEKHVASLIAQHPIDEAMSLAVGGGYGLIGRIEAEMLKSIGLVNDMHLVDLGCGSGRLAYALHQSMNIRYTGTDIVQSLLDYARQKAPAYQFHLHPDLSIPAPDESADMVSAFSLFTHLLHAETYLYLEEAKRVLKPSGKIVFSFLEFSEPLHWSIFESTKASTKNSTAPHLNMFIERSAIEAWASHLGMTVTRFIPATEKVWETHALGQSAVVFEKA